MVRAWFGQQVVRAWFGQRVVDGCFLPLGHVWKTNFEQTRTWLFGPSCSQIPAFSDQEISFWQHGTNFFQNPAEAATIWKQTGTGGTYQTNFATVLHLDRHFMSYLTPCPDPVHRCAKRELYLAHIKNTQEYKDFASVMSASSVHPSRPSAPVTPRGFENWTKQKWNAEVYNW